MQPTIRHTIAITITETWTITWHDGQETTWQTTQEVRWPTEPETADALLALTEVQAGDAPEKNEFDHDSTDSTDG